MAKKRVAVIGVGYLGKFHAEKFAAMDNIELTAIVDTNKAVVEALAKKLDTKFVYDYHEIEGMVDAVTIAVPTMLHFEVASFFLARGVDVMLEKPIASTLEEADELIVLAKTHNCILQVGHLERFNPALLSLKDEITYPLFIESHRLSMFSPRSLDVSVVLDLMIHDIDIILAFVKSDVVAIHASGAPVISSLPDIANVRIEFASGCVANVTASRISVKKQRRMRFFQKDMYLSVDFDKSEATLIKRTSKEGGIIPGMDIRTENFSAVDNLKDELSDFADCIVTRRAPRVSGTEARRALAVARDIVTQINQNIERLTTIDEHQ